MKRIIRIFCVLLTAALVVGCTTTRYTSIENDLRQNAVGKSHSFIVGQLGAPDRETSDGNGGRILIYEKFTQNTIATQTGNLFYSVPSATTTTRTDYAQFYIDRYGDCYDVRSNLVSKDVKFAPGKTILLVLCTLLVLSSV